MVVARRGYSSHQVQKYLELAPPPLGTHDLSALFPALRAEFTPLEEKSDRATLIAAFVALNLHTWLLDTAIVFTFASIALILVITVMVFVPPANWNGKAISVGDPVDARLVDLPFMQCTTTGRSIELILSVWKQERVIDVIQEKYIAHMSLFEQIDLHDDRVVSVFLVGVDEPKVLRG